MAKIICYAISCSSDASLHATKLYVWGGVGATWLPQTMVEAKKQVAYCQKQKKCEHCDAEIHRLEITRTEKTYSQYLSYGED